jgi:peptidyl-prolyl cis-trans isomerase C
MRIGGALLLHCALVLAAGGCGEGKKTALSERRSGDIARVGEVFLTREHLENLLPENEHLPLTDEEKKQFINRWINTELLYQEAIRRGLGDDPRVRLRLEEFEREYLADHLVYLELRERTRVTEQDIEDFFDEHRDEYLYEYRVSHILVNTLEEAEDVKELLEKKSFSWVANHHSIDPVAKRGGDLGYLTKGNMIPEFENVIFRMKPGDVSGIVRSDFGYHIIKLVGMRESLVKVSLDDVRQNIMNKLVIEKREQAYREFLDSLRTALGVAYIDARYAPAPPATEADSVVFSEPGDTQSVRE